MKEYLAMLKANVTKLEKNIRELEEKKAQWEKKVDSPLSYAQKQVDEIRNTIKLRQDRLQKLKKTMKIIRPRDEKDMQYRFSVYNGFADRLESVLPEENDLCFHGTSLIAAQEIISSGKIKGKKYFCDENDKPDKMFYVTTSSSLYISMQGYLNLHEDLIPAGVLFVIKATNEEEYELAERSLVMKEFYLKDNPDKLIGMISTPENIPVLKKWCRKCGISEDKVFDFGTFMVFAKQYGTNREFDI